MSKDGFQIAYEEGYLYLGRGQRSGKSYIGNLLEEELEIPFLQVEPLLLAHIERFGEPAEGLSRHGFDIEERAIGDILEKQDAVIFEATGSSEYFPGVVVNLRDAYRVKLIRVNCPLDICFNRVRNRDTSDHFRLTEERVSAINNKAILVNFDWDLESTPGPGVGRYLN